MNIILISESKVGNHHKVNNPNIIQFSTRGSSIVKITPKGYKINEKFLKKVIDRNPRLVLLGTDLDLQGTKIATLLKFSFESMGIKTFRFALTNKGYIHIGEFLDKGRLKAIYQGEKENINFAKFIAKKHSINGIGKKTFFLVGAIEFFKENLKTVKNLNPQGSNTFTAIVKGLNNRYSLTSITQQLRQMYYQGKIPYPRVDNDYIQNNPYDLYPHPPFKDYGYIHYLITPIEEEELPFNSKTIWLQFCNERIMTPATIPYYFKKFNNIYYNFETLNPREDLKNFYEEAKKFYIENKEEIKKELHNLYHPQLTLSKPIPLPKFNKLNENEIEDLLYELEYELINQKRFFNNENNEFSPTVSQKTKKFIITDKDKNKNTFKRKFKP